MNKSTKKSAKLNLHNSKIIQWILRIAVAGEFIGHGVFALEGKAVWVGWIQQVTSLDVGPATTLLFMVGILDIIVALIVLFHPIHAALAWAVFWGFLTALIRPIMGESFWDFIERWANWGAPFALLLLLGHPKNWKHWFTE